MYPPGLPPPTTPTPAKSGRGLTIVLAIALVAVIGVGIVLVLSARSDTDSVQSQLDTLNHKLKITQQAAGTDQSSASDTADQLAAVTKKEADDQKMIADQQANIASLQQQVDAKTASVAQLTNQLNTVQSDATASKTAVEQANAALTAAKADLTKAQANLTTAQANATALGTPFVVDVTQIRPPTKDFSVTGSRVACNGFTDPATACPDNQTLSGHINNDAGKLTLEVPGFVLVPLASFDGFNYVGSAPVANGSGFTCGAVSNTTTMNVTISPTHYTIGPTDKSVIDTSLSVTWTLSSPAGACVASTYTYHGFFDYS